MSCTALIPLNADRTPTSLKLISGPKMVDSSQNSVGEHRRSSSWFLNFAGKVAVFLIGSVCMNPSSLSGCGINWNPTFAPFDGLDSDGKVCVRNEVGQLQLTNKIKIPLSIMFSSAANPNNGLMGYGWICPFLESNIIQADENTFCVMLPDGKKVNLKRTSNNPNLLSGAGWNAEVIGNSIDIRAECGWRASYLNGKIVSLAGPGDVQVWYRYQEGELSTVSTRTGEILRVRRETGTGSQNQALTLELGMTDKVVIQFGERPVVVGRDKLFYISSIRKSVAELLTQDGKTLRFNYEFSQDGKESLHVDNKTENRDCYTWNVGNKKLETANGWAYKVTGDGDEVPRTFERFLESDPTVHQLEYSNPQLGIRKYLTPSGELRVVHTFTSGALAGLLRKVESATSLKNECLAVQEKRSYDERGRLLQICMEKNTLNISQQNNNEMVTWQNQNSGRSLSIVGDSSLKVIKANNKTYTFVSLDDVAITVEDSESHRSLVLPRSEFEYLLINNKITNN